MKTISDGVNITRVNDTLAELKVKTGQYSYVTKLVWKKNVRDIKQTLAEEIKVDKPKKIKNEHNRSK